MQTTLIERVLWDLSASQLPFPEKAERVGLFSFCVLSSPTFLSCSLVVAGTEFSFGWIARFIEVRRTVNIDCGSKVNADLQG